MSYPNYSGNLVAPLSARVGKKKKVKQQHKPKPIQQRKRK